MSSTGYISFSLLPSDQRCAAVPHVSSLGSCGAHLPVLEKGVQLGEVHYNSARGDISLSV